MKVEIREDETRSLPERTFPWAGVGTVTGRVVLFSSPGIGVVIAGQATSTDGTGGIGYHSDDLAIDNFTPFNGTLTFSENLPR